MRLTAIAPESKLKVLGESRRMSINTSTLLQDTVLKTLMHRLIEQLGSNLQELWLFGSRARGDGEADADYDVLVVAGGDQTRNRRILLEESNALMEDHNALVGMLDYSPAAWQKTKKNPLGLNILREGIRLV